MGLILKIFRMKDLKQKGRKNLFIVPYFFTFANAVFGLISVIKTFEGDFTGAAYCIIFAGVMDMFDGRLARAFGSTSYLGMELDSLCDAVSFCFAPVILLYSWYFHDLGVLGFVVLSLYLCCGLLRLAKFNISSVQQADNGDHFVGLTTTLAAFLVAQLVINFDWISKFLMPFLLYYQGVVLFVVIIAFLMISPISFPSFKGISSRFSLLAGAFVVTIFTIGFFYGLPLLFLGIFSYILSSIFYFAVSKFFNI